MKTPDYCEYACIDRDDPKCPIPTRLEQIAGFCISLAPSAGIPINASNEMPPSKLDSEFAVTACIAEHV